MSRGKPRVRAFCVMSNQPQLDSDVAALEAAKDAFDAANAKAQASAAQAASDAQAASAAKSALHAAAAAVMADAAALDPGADHTGA